jgi:hypothetical protein
LLGDPNQGVTTDGDTTEDSTGTTGDSATSGSSTGSVPVSVCPEFIDDFEDGVEDSRWIQPYPLSTQEIDGVSRFTVTPALNDEFVRMMVAPESGMVGTTVTVELGETSDAVGMESTLWIQREGTERLSFRRYASNDDVLLEVFVRDGTGMTSVVHGEAFDDVEHQFLRVVGDATTLSFEVSSDGVSFTPVHTGPNPFGGDPVQVGFVGNNRSALLGAEIVSFESFSITCPQP